MEKASQNILSLSELVGFLFMYPVLNWVDRISNFYFRFLPCVGSQIHFFAAISRFHDDYRRTCTSDENTKSAFVQTNEHLRLSREEVERVMETMGISCDKAGEQLKEYVGSDDISSLFEEKEPSLEEVKAAFYVFDENRDGFIDAEELQRVLNKLGFREASTVEACERMIGAYDENSDGRIDFLEFVKFMESSFC